MSSVVALGRFFCKPWRVIELTCAVGRTALTIPEDITGIEYKIKIPYRVKAALISKKYKDNIGCSRFTGAA